MKKFEISWRCENHHYIEIEAETAEEAVKIWQSGEWDEKEVGCSDSQIVSDENEVIENTIEVED